MKKRIVRRESNQEGNQESPEHEKRIIQERHLLVNLEGLVKHANPVLVLRQKQVLLVAEQVLRRKERQSDDEHSAKKGQDG